MLATFFVAFLFVTICTTISWTSLQALDHPSFVRNPFGVFTIILALIALAFAILAFLTPPIVVPKEKIAIWGPWWRPVLTLFLLLGLSIAVSAVTGRTLNDMVARFAESLGGHYYTYLNLAGPAFIICIALAAATQLGTVWARAVDHYEDVEEA